MYKILSSLILLNIQSAIRSFDLVLLGSAVFVSGIRLSLLSARYLYVIARHLLRLIRSAF